MVKHLKVYEMIFTYIISILVFMLLISNYQVIYAHSGGTDSTGGHYDNSTEKYHYHHGYAAHQHPNGKCPYNFNDNTKDNNSHSISDSWIYIISAAIVISPYILIAFGSHIIGFFKLLIFKILNLSLAILDFLKKKVFHIILIEIPILLILLIIIITASR